jgi:uncharacterized membrane protein
MIDWLVRLPTIVLFLGLMVVGLLVAVALTRASERAFSEEARTRTGTSVATVVGVIAGLYAVLIAFVIVNEWQAFNDAQSQVSSESASLSATYISAGVLPPASRAQVQQALLAYDRSVVCVEFPHLGRHDGPAIPTRRALERLAASVARAEPTVQNQAFYASTVKGVYDLTQARRGRINSAESPLPPLLLIVVAITSLALIAAVSALDTQHRRWHTIFTVGLTFIVALNLALVVSLDRPFDGAAKVSDAPLREGVPARDLRC